VVVLEKVEKAEETEIEVATEAAEVAKSAFL
jgi:hypothetical protein